MTRPKDWPELVRLHQRCALAATLQTETLTQAGGDPAGALAAMTGQLFAAALEHGLTPDMSKPTPLPPGSIVMRLHTGQAS